MAYYNVVYYAFLKFCGHFFTWLKCTKWSNLERLEKLGSGQKHGMAIANWLLGWCVVIFTRVTLSSINIVCCGFRYEIAIKSACSSLENFHHIWAKCVQEYRRLRSSESFSPSRTKNWNHGRDTCLLISLLLSEKHLFYGHNSGEKERVIVANWRHLSLACLLRGSDGKRHAGSSLDRARHNVSQQIFN